LIGSPDGEDDEEDEGGEIDGAASADTGGAANVDHCDVGEPHGEGQKDLGVAEVRGTDSSLRDEGADEQASGHAGKAKEEGLESDLVGGFERGEPGEGGGFLFEAALLN